MRFFKKESSTILETVVLFVFFITFMYFGLGTLTNHGLENELPINYGANDAYIYSAYTTYALDTDQIRTISPMYSHGVENIAFFQPILRVVSEIELSHFAGISPYDSIYVMLIFFTFLTTMMFYLMLRSYKKEVAMLSLPLSITVFSFPFLAAFYWGIWSFVSGIMYFPALLYFIRFYNKKYFVPIMTMLVAGQILSYVRLTPFIFLFIIGYYLRQLWKKEIKLSTILMKWAIIFMCSAVLIIYPMSILSVPYDLFSGESATAYIGGMPPANFTGFTVPLFTHFRLFAGVLILFGLGLILLFAGNDYRLMAFAYLFILVSSNFVFGKSVFKMRLFWPIYAGGLFGFAIYYLIDTAGLILKKLSENKIYICSILSIILLFFFAINYVHPLGRGLSEPSYNNAYAWLKSNTSSESKILYFHGEYFLQNTFRVSERDSYFANMDSLVNQSQIIKVEGSQDADRTMSKRLGAFNFMVTNDHKFENQPESIKYDICSYDYFVFGRQGMGEFIDLSNKYYAKLITAGNLQVYSNNLIFILKNEKGGNCFET